jgi:hypothetical protein
MPCTFSSGARSDFISKLPGILWTPEILKSLLARFCIAGRVLDGAMAEPILNCPRVVPFVGQGVAAGMPQHVHVNLEREAGAFADALDQAMDGIGREWRAALGLENTRGSLSKNWTTKGEDEPHPRLVCGRSLETDTTWLLWAGDYSESV